MVNADWTVLLVGGASGVGKSCLSQPLGRRLDVNVGEVDDFQIVLESSSTPEQLPLLHFWKTNRDEFMTWTDEHRLDHFVRVCRDVFQPALEAVIADHLDTGTRVILEGDFLLPELAARATFSDRSNGGRVAGVFVSEPDDAQLAANLEAREGDVQPERLRGSVLLDRLIAADCARLGVPIVAARPWNTVVDRALVALSLAPDHLAVRRVVIVSSLVGAGSRAARPRPARGPGLAVRDHPTLEHPVRDARQRSLLLMPFPQLASCRICR